MNFILYFYVYIITEFWFQSAMQMSKNFKLVFVIWQLVRLFLDFEEL